MRLATNTLSKAPQGVTGPEDAVQSAFLCFWQQATDGKFREGVNRDDLWALLSVMTVRKARQHLRGERAKKRGGDRQRVPVEGIVGRDDAFGELSPAEFDLFSEELLLHLDEGLRPFALLRLMGHSNAESSQIMECTERTVERKIRLIRKMWESLVEDE